jgi:hypothetical protein
MAKSKHSKDKKKYNIVQQELEEFNDLIKGHKKLLVAIGSL